MASNHVGFQKFTRFWAIAGLILAMVMTAVPAGTAVAAPVQQATGPVSAATVCTTLQPDEAASQDAWIDQGSVTTNKNDSELRVKTEANKLNRSLIKFDLSGVAPTNAKITTATLSLYVKDVRDGNSTVQAHQVIDWWTENAVTWLSQDKVALEDWSNPGGDYDTAVLDSESFTQGVKDYWATFNISGAAQNWAADPAANYGVILESAVTDPKSEVKFKSSADGTASQRPSLEVCWEVGVGISPDNLDQGTAGQSNFYSHTVTVQDFTGEPVGLSALSNEGWPVTIYEDENGNGVKDAGDDPITQTPPLGPNGSTKILVEVVVPANTPNGTKDITTVTATGLNNGTVDTATNTTLVGFPPVADPVLDGRRDLAYTQSLDSVTQDYCAAPGQDGAGTVLARTMTLYDVANPDYVWVILEMDLAHVDNSYGDNIHPSWGSDSHSLGNLDGSDKGQVILRDANGTVIFDVTADYVEPNMSTVSGWGSAGVTGGDGSVAVGTASQVAVESSIGYDLNRFCTSSASCTVNGVNLFQDSPPVNIDYTPVDPAFADWVYPYLYEFRFDSAAFGSAGFGSVTINNVHVSPNKTGANEIIVVPCGGSIGDRVWQDRDGDTIQDSSEPGLNGVMVNLYRDTGNGTFEPGTDLAIDTRFTSGDGDYDFTGLGPGTYFVDVVESTIPADYVLTTANEPMKVELGLGQDYNDADFGYRTLPDLTIEKNLISGDPAFVGQTVTYEIIITNVGNTVIDVLPLEDYFDPAYLAFQSASPAASTASGAIISWNDLTTSLGDLGVGDSHTVTVNFQAIFATTTTTSRRAATLAATSSLSTEPVVDGLLEADYTFVGRSDPGGDAPGNLYQYTGDSQCYYAFVVDRSFNDNVYAQSDSAYLLLDGWDRTHKYSDLDGSDKAIFTISGSVGTYAAMEVDYITKSGGLYTVAFFDAPINDAKTSLWYNLNLSGWDGSGPAPQYDGTVEYHSPPYDWNDAPGQYWEWAMIYEFSIPKASVGPDCGSVTLAGAHNSPSKNDASLGLIGDYIWADLDAQGDQDEVNAGLANVRVNLYQNNTLVRSTQTEPGTSGFYVFSNLAAGTYVVDVDESTLPAGYTLTTNNEPKTVNLTAGGSYLQADFGYVPGQGTIGDEVYYDINGNGSREVGEPGINGVTLNLYTGVCPVSGSPNPANLRGTEITVGDGDYDFAMLPAGDYCVDVDEATLPTGYLSTSSNEPMTVNLGQDQDFNDADFGYQAFCVNGTPNVASVSNAQDQYGTSPDPVEDHVCVEIGYGTTLFDWGDLPDTGSGTSAGNYQTLAANNGPRHAIKTLKLGATIDAESDGQPNATATGDDLVGDDEDGITIPQLAVGQSAMITVNASGPGKLNAFIDWNNDGDFDDAGERIPELSVVAGNNSLNVTVPSTAASGVPIGARFRLSSQGGLDATDDGLSGSGYLPTAKISEYLVIAMGDDADIGRAFQMSNTEIGADRKILSVAQDPGYVTDGGFPNLFDVFDVRWNTSTDPDSINGAATLFQGIDWSGEVALTSNNGKFDSSNSLVFADTGIQTVNGSPLASVSDSKYYDVGVVGPSGPNLAVGNGVTVNNDHTDLLTDLARWKTYLTGLSAEATITNLGDFVNNPASNGNGGLRTSYADSLDTNGDNLIVVDINVGLNDFDVNNTDWVIDGSGNKLVVFRLRNGSNMLISNGSILMGNGGIADRGLGVLFLSAYEGSSSSDTVFNFNNVVATGVGFWDLNAVGEGSIYFDTEIVINNGQGCAQFISQKVNFQNNRWNRCELADGTPDGEVEDYLVTIEPANGAIGDFVWADLDRDGIQDPGEPGIAGVALNLYDSSGTLIHTTTTDASGIYTFTALASGTYTVEVDPAEFSLNNLLYGWDASPIGQGGDPAKDSNGSATLHQASVTLAADATDITIDFGFYGSGKSTLGDYVWYDANADGDHLGTEAEFGSAGIDGVLIKLYLDDGDGVFEPGSNGVNGQDRIWGVRTTGPKPGQPNTQGWYEFDIVGDGNIYWAYVDPSNFAPGGPLESLIFTNDDTVYQASNPQYVAEPGIVIQVTNVDFGYVRGGAIGDFVWYDSNSNGIQDVGEPGIPNVTLDLYQDTDGTPGLNIATDTLVDSTVTDADGGYLFTDLQPGDYFVDVTDLNGQLTGLTHIVANQSMPDPTAAITLAAGGVYKDADFGYVDVPDTGKAIVGDTVWFDDNGDGVQQPSEPGIPNVTVTVYDSNNNPIGTADTDENGIYRIEVPAGSGYTASPDPADIPAGLTATTPVPHLLPPLNPGDQYLDADFGYNDPGNLLGTIGNLVFEDVNKDGVFNSATDAGLPGVSVDLIRDLNGNKTWDAGEPIIATVTTDKDGAYLFTGLPADDYLVHVSDTNAALINYVKGPLGAAGVNNNSQADPYAITLPAGGDNLTADFGYVKLDPNLGQIGNQVWTEMDANGLFNPTGQDVGQPGVTVDLFKDGVFYARTTTGASGDYLFPSLPGGDYTVQVSDIYNVLDGYLVTTLGPNQGSDDNNQLQPYQIVLSQGGENLTADFGYTLQGAIGDYVFYDSDADAIQDVGEPGIGNVTLNLYKDNGDNVLNTAQDTLVGTATTDNDGGYLFTGLAQGVYFVDVTDTVGVLTGLDHTVGTQSQPDPSNPITLNVGETYRDADFGYVKQPDTGKAIIGDTVWYDGDGDGIQDPGEPGIPGIEVCATPVGGGAPVCDTTDQNGVYQVEVPAGAYTVAPTNPPAGYTATTPVPHGPVTVSAGDQYLDADFGYDKPGELGTISGTIWEDTPDKDGVLDPGEDPIPGVSVSLIEDTNGNKVWDPGEPVIATDTTDQNGDYLFDGVPPGDYLVLPTDTQNVLDDFQPTVPGPNPGQDNNNQVQPYPVSLPAGGSNSTGDFGYVRNPGNETGLIGNQVWYETDGNGLYNPDSGDKGIAGVTVDLYLNGALLATTTTGAGGDYVFTGLAAGVYTVTVSDNVQVLEDYILTVLGPVQGSDNNNQAQAYQVTLPVAGSNMTADFGYTRPSAIGDFVWYDANKDGIEDVGEPGIPNVTLDLWRDKNGDGTIDGGDEKIASTVTDADGGYLFPNLVAGDYIVDVTDTNNVLSGLDQIVANQAMPDPTGKITIGAGVKYEDADFAYVDTPTPGSAIIGDTVWYDDNGDGIQQPGEPGIPGIEVCATPVGGGAAVCDTTDENGIYRVEVPAGTYTVQPTNPPVDLTATTPVPHGPVTVVDGQQYLDADFGYDDPGQNLLGTIGNLVFAEAKATRDGLYNGTDTPLAGVSVDLIRDTNGNKVWDAGEPIIATTTTAATTDANTGNYLFTGLPAGNYLVHVSDTNAVLLDYNKTILGANQRLDNNNQVDPYWVTLAVGGDNLTADFGYYRAERPNVGVIGNQIWIESVEDGLFDATGTDSQDVGQAGVTVELLKDGVLYRTTTSGPSGDYSFVGLPAGDYTVRVTDAQGVLLGYRSTVLGPNPGQDNNNQAQPYAVALPTNGVNLTADFGYFQTIDRYTLTKRLTSPAVARVNEVVVFSIRITNTGTSVLMSLPLTDTYDTEYLRYISSVPASVDNVDDGAIDWTDLTATQGIVAPGESVQVTVSFVALKDTGELPNDVTINVARVTGVTTDPDGTGPSPTNPTPLPPQTDNDVVQIINPTATLVTDGRATLSAEGVALGWRTISEADVAGFNLLRTHSDGSVTVLNSSLILAQKSGQAEGATYAWADVTASADTVYTYSLEILGLDGTKTQVELGSVQLGSTQSGSVIFLPLVVK